MSPDPTGAQFVLTPDEGGGDARLHVVEDGVGAPHVLLHERPVGGATAALRRRLAHHLLQRRLDPLVLQHHLSQQQWDLTGGTMT